MKLKDRKKRYGIIVNFISAKILAKTQNYYSYNIVSLYIMQ